MGDVTQAHKPPSHHSPGFDFIPSQPRRKLSLPGGSAAKVFESRSQKTNLKQQKRGEFFAAHPAGSIFGNSGMLGSPFFGYFLWRDKESDLPPATPANGHQPNENPTIRQCFALSPNWIASLRSQRRIGHHALTTSAQTPTPPPHAPAPSIRASQP